MTFNRNEQRALIFLASVLIIGAVISLIDRHHSDQIEDFDVIKNAVAVPQDTSGAQAEVHNPLKVNLNTASSQDLQRLPRIGPKVAQRIIEYRKKNGPFQSLDDLADVPGIGPKTIDQFRSLVVIEE